MEESIFRCDNGFLNFNVSDHKTGVNFEYHEQHQMINIKKSFYLKKDKIPFLIDSLQEFLDSDNDVCIGTSWGYESRTNCIVDPKDHILGFFDNDVGGPGIGLTTVTEDNGASVRLNADRAEKLGRRLVAMARFLRRERGEGNYNTNNSGDKDNGIQHGDGGGFRFVPTEKDEGDKETKQ